MSRDPVRPALCRILLAFALAVAAALALFDSPLHAQWTHRYPKVDGYSHHVYLEGYELPTMNAGPTAPAVSPDGGKVAFSARGWIWLLDLESGRATRVTDGPHMDFRPAWSPDGRSIAFVRDDTRDTWIVVRELESGAETAVNSEAIELDPIFEAGGELVYSSASAGTLDLWTADGERLSSRPGIEVAPSLSADGSVLVYLHKGSGDRIVARLAGDSGREEEQEEEQEEAQNETQEVVLASERIVSQTRPEVSPDGELVAYNWPTQDGYELRLVAIADPTTSVRLTTGRRGLPLAPTWGPDGEWIWYTEADRHELMRLYRIPAVGGEPEEVPIRAWDWGAEVGTVRVTTRLRSGEDGPARAPARSMPADPTPGRTTDVDVTPGQTSPAGSVPARLEVVDGSGHPAVPTSGHAQLGLEDGRVFFYSPGIVELVVPAGEVTVSAVRGLATPEVSRSVEVRPGRVTEVDLALEPVWDARRSGYLSGDHHFHLNYGGPYVLDPEDLLPMMAGEDLDVGTPLLANLHNRFEDQELWGWERAGGVPLIEFGQEVRSHFLGHVGLLDTETLFWPWIWGPGYQVYGRDDRPNAAPLGHAREQGGLGGYVHPTDDRDPFAPDNHGNWPVLLAADGILGTMDWLEVACLWTDELGAAEMWYRFLNLGVPILLEAGTDVMNDYYRTMPVGTTRLYVDTDGAESLDAYWRGFRGGRSFVTTGPMIELEVDGAVHGDTVLGGRAAPFRLELASAIPVDTVEVVVNGEVVWSAAGLSEPGTRSYEGEVDLPDAGWVAVRAHGGAPTWPVMDQLVFAHTSPIWIDHVGSVQSDAARRAAADLLPVLGAAEAELRETYGETPTPTILETFRAARERLQDALQDPAAGG